MASTKALQTTVLHFHGLGGSSRSKFALDAKKLVESRRLRFKSVEYRSTNDAKSVWSVDRWLEDVLYELDSNPKPSILLGVSAGCHSVLRGTLQRPSSVSGLLLISPGVGLVNADRYVRTVLPNQADDLLNGKTVLHPHDTDGQPALVNLEALRRYAETCVSNMAKVPIRCPVGIIHGECDQVVPYRNVEEFVKKLESTNVNLQVLPKAGHRFGVSEKIERMFDWLLQEIENKRRS